MHLHFLLGPTVDQLVDM